MFYERNALFAYRNAIMAPWTEAESATSIAMGNGTKVLYVPSGTRFYRYGGVEIIRSSDRTKRMWGAIVAFDRTTGRTEILVTSTVGSGTHADWTLRLAKYADGTWYSSLPPAKLDDKLLFEHARSVGALPSATRLRVDLGRQTVAQLFAVLRSNLEPEAKFRLRLLDLAASTGMVTVVYDSAKQDLWRPTELYGKKPWGGFRWSGKVVPPGGRSTPYFLGAQTTLPSRTPLTIAAGLVGQVVSLVTDGSTEGFDLNQRVSVAGDGNAFVGLLGVVDALAANRMDLYVTDVEGPLGEGVPGAGGLTRDDWTIRGVAADAAAETYQARFAQIDFFDQANAAGFIDVAGMMLSPVFQSRINIEEGSDEIGLIDPGVRRRSIGGQLYVTPRAKYPRAAFTLPALDPSESFATVLLEIMSEMGVSEPMLLMLDPGDDENAMAQTIYGTLTSLQPMRGRFQDIKSWAVEFEGYD